MHLSCVLFFSVCFEGRKHGFLWMFLPLFLRDHLTILASHKLHHDPMPMRLAGGPSCSGCCSPNPLNARVLEVLMFSFVVALTQTNTGSPSAVQDVAKIIVVREYFQGDLMKYVPYLVKHI